MMSTAQKLPETEKALKLNKFRKFIRHCGGQILTNTNEYELLRVQTDTGVLILYKNKSGTLNWPEQLKEAYAAYRSGGEIPWRAAPKATLNRKRTPVLIKTLFERDGCQCWYCGAALTVNTATIEHLLNVCHGGSNHLSNLTIACGYCNNQAKNLCIVQKVALRGRLRLERKAG